MKPSIRLLSVLFLLCVGSSSMAQNLQKANVLKMSGRNTGEIMSSDGTVKGYYFFYNVESKRRDSNEYLLEVMDENLRLINSIELVRQRSVSLIEADYNGKAFVFLFYNPKLNKSELLSYDANLKPLGTLDKPIKGLTDQMYKMAAAGYETGYSFITAIDNTGFIYNGYVDDKKYKYVIEQYSNSLELKWSAKSPDLESKQVEAAEVAFQSTKYIGSLISRRESIWSKDGSYDILVHDASTGAELFRKEIKDETYNVSISKIEYIEELNEILLFGEYFALQDKEFKAASLGYFFEVIDISGNSKERKWLSWEKEMSKVLPVDKTGKMDKNGRIFIHDIIINKEKQLFVVGEQYKKAASGMGIAMKIASQGRSRTATVQLEIMNMVILGFSPTMEIKSAEIIEKSPHLHLLPAGYEQVATKLIGMYAKSAGWFDYSFTQINKVKNTFSIAYVNWDNDNEKGEVSHNVLGLVTYTPEKVFIIDKTDLTRKSTNYYVRRAKPGYVFIGEYFKKEKRFDYRLEKINY